MTHGEYIRSLNWLLKKYELIGVYLREGWRIECRVCESTDSLNVHHDSYENFGNEIVTDERIWELVFLCRTHHQEIHRDKNYKQNLLELETTPEKTEEFFRLLAGKGF